MILNVNLCLGENEKNIFIKLIIVISSLSLTSTAFGATFGPHNGAVSEDSFWRSCNSITFKGTYKYVFQGKKFYVQRKGTIAANCAANCAPNYTHSTISVAGTDLVHNCAGILRVTCKRTLESAFITGK